MTVKHYYIEYKVWAEGQVDVPWPFVVFGETNDYRYRYNLSRIVTHNELRSCFISMNSSRIDKFLENNVNAVILGSVISATSIDEVKGKIDLVFGFCEIIGIQLITKENFSKVAAIMDSAVKLDGAVIT